MIKRSENDSILIESLGFQQLIAKASEEVKKKLERERPEAATEIQTVAADVAGELIRYLDQPQRTIIVQKRQSQRCTSMAI